VGTVRLFEYFSTVEFFLPVERISASHPPVTQTVGRFLAKLGIKMSDKKTSLIDMAFALGLLAFLFISYGFDRASYSIGKYATTNHDIKNLPFGKLIPFIYPNITLFIGAIAFLVFWVIANKIHLSKWVEIFYLFIGSLVAFAYSLSKMFTSPEAMPNLLEQIFRPRNYLHISGSLVAVIGLLMLILPKNNNGEKNKSLLFDISFLVGLPIFLYICYFLDITLFRIPSYIIDKSPSYKVLFWYYPVALLFVEIAALLLFWFVQNKLQLQKWVKILYLTIGLFITYAYDLLHIKAIQELLPPYIFNSQLPTVILLQDIFWVNYHLHIAGTLIVVMSLLSLFLPKKIMSRVLIIYEYYSFPKKRPTKRALDLWVRCGFSSIVSVPNIFLPVE
jgi:hypothetical protein